MSATARPPRLARRLLALIVPAPEREYWLGDIEEEFTTRFAAGPAAARRWYRRQVRRAIVHRLGSTPGRGRGSSRLAEGFWSDLGYAVRSLRRAPGFVVLASLTLGIGIGANAMIYAVVDAVLIQGLPFEDPDRLVLLRNTYADGREGSWLLSFPDYEDYRAGTPAFAELAAWREQLPALASDDGRAAERLNAIDATANLLPMLGVEPILGRQFSGAEDSPDTADRAAMLSHAFWRSRFGGDPGILGQTIELDGVAFVVVGILPAGFTGTTGGLVLPATPADVWLSYRSSFSGNANLSLRGLTNVNVLGRLAPGATLEQALGQVEAVAASLDERFADDRTNMAPQLLPAQNKAVEGVQAPILIAFGAVSLLLLIAGTNVANLLIGRASARRRELALRAALGARRGRLLRQLVFESLLLAGLGAMIGTAIAAAGVRALIATQALEIARVEAVGLDLRVLGFLSGIAALAGLVFGIGPALFATRSGPARALRDGSRSVAAGASVGRRALVVAQLALAVVLLVGAGLMLRSLQHVLNVDPGFEAEGVLTARVQLPTAFVSADWPQSVELFDTFVRRLEALPGVEGAAAAYQLPTDSGWNNAFRVDPADVGRTIRELPEEEIYSARFRPVTAGYFELLGIGLRQGRTLRDSDSVDAPRVVVVNQSFVDRYIESDESPLGVRLDYGNWWAAGPREYEIVGVVDDVRFSGRTAESLPATYFAHPQQPVRELTVLVATAGGDPLGLVPTLRTTLAGIDPGLPLDDVSLLHDRLAAQEAQRRSLSNLLVVFAAAALLLAAVGVYGVMTFLVQSRRHEVGIRLALGAQRRDVRRMVLGTAVGLAAVGILIGLAAAYLLGGALDRMLYETGAADPTTYASVAAFLILIAVAAGWLPARRATGVDPMVSLRRE